MVKKISERKFGEQAETAGAYETGQELVSVCGV